jgi:DNA topoisomerase VI subunit B
MLAPNILEGFDPLSTGEIEHSAIDQIIQESQKRDVLNILRSYTGTLDIFSEAIQNAIDAVDQRMRMEADYTPRIWITIDMKHDRLRFVDNGIGMGEQHVKYFLRLNVSFKTADALRGHKGVSG